MSLFQRGEQLLVGLGSAHRVGWLQKNCNIFKNLQKNILGVVRSAEQFRLNSSKVLLAKSCYPKGEGT